LDKAKIKAEAIHGNKSQNARQRALSNFKDYTTRVLVATDIAARGIDIDALAFVVNFELPNIPETYVHRIGRTGRAGASGKAVSFCDYEERAYLKDIQKLISMQLPIVEKHPFPAKIFVIEKEEKRTFNNQRGGSGGSNGSGKRPQGGNRPAGGGGKSPEKRRIRVTSDE
jgi:ATP-dependent RNA helicase RhlE